MSLASSALADRLIAPVLEAGRAALAIREAGLDVSDKADASPVTEADRAAEAILIDAIETVAPGTLIVAEERAEAHGLPADGAERFWLVDPLDGTKEFIKGGEDFTVNVALIEQGQPVLGLVYAPVQDRLFWGVAGHGAKLRVGGQERLIATRAMAQPPAVVASRSHRSPETDAYLARFPGADCVSVGSSLKFCLVAMGEADLYPRLGPTMEWDTAAGDAVLRAAGGQVIDTRGQPFLYNKPGFKNGFFVAWGDATAPAPPAPDAVLHG
ncbi:MAG: 3'(2'),5'-bisphosphate nucleotidase CysQ [Rhodothalassiaceae bacterium]